MPASVKKGRLRIYWLEKGSDVPRASGPTIARWQLGRQIKAAREAARITQIEIAEVLACSESKIYKLEAGDVGINRGDLIVMLDRYGITDEQRRLTIFDLQQQGKQRGWWAKYGQLPSNYSMYVGLEGAAVEVKNFELAVVPGLLQTEEYAHAITSAAWPGQEDEVRRRVELRMARQACLTEDPPLKFWGIVDEGVLHRRTGGAEVMRAQLRHLIDLSKRPNIELQVVPFGEGWHPGAIGSFSILEFPEDVHSPVAYVVSQAGDAYLEREDDMRRVTLTYTHLHAAALSASKSRDLIAAIARDLG
ncbi:helix-turn-helix transcriptional regulator [Solwaraspora sp. WMMD1047]|uniref:helix-turn-helix domain-containing protein n=1 Tax=Solwaraspora sp. WMMD1047 TaxID=3016102 RepID=UPI002417DF3D|nr:helix-turn-helix transcriptional regulator [Solwaraspora sp. WMMD1047]MDG4827893.1 helix-turn-helix transcriptional regulator [Solwaraspora sp. WMMD1047]